MKNIRALQGCLAACLLASLAACGGGGGSPGTPGGSTGSGGGTGGGVDGSGGSGSTPSVDQYVATWVRCVPTGSATSERETLALNKTSDTAMVYSDVVLTFNNANCAGNSASQSNTNGTVLFTGTKVIGTDTVDEVEITPTGSTTTQKEVLVVRADLHLYEGVVDANAVLDANGYPSTLDPNGFASQ